MVSKTIFYTLVVTYKQPGQDWASMGEIIPALEEAWRRSASRNHQVDFFVIGRDLIKKQKNLQKFFKAGRIVFLSSMPYKSVSQLINLLRNKLALQTPFLIYGHDLASIGGVRLYWQGLIPFLGRQDEWIFTTESEAKLWQKYFPQTATHFLPFPLYKKVKTLQVRNESEKCLNFLFVGRISEQKMLHFSLWALSLFKEKYPKRKFIFHIVGRQDHLGSPNMGIKFSNYEKFLKNLVKKLQLQNEVIFHGHQSRSVLDKNFFSRPHIFYSLSLHSDENFGAALLRSLSYGNRSLVSGWGGHQIFKKILSKNVTCVPVRKSPMGPILSVDEVVNCLEKMTRRPMTLNQTQEIVQRHNILQKKFSTSSQSEILKKMAQNLKPGGKLIVSQKVMALKNQHQKLWEEAKQKSNLTSSQKEEKINRLFISYADKLAVPFWYAFGMERKSNRFKVKRLSFPPWFKVNGVGDKVYINDPRWGKIVCDCSRANELLGGMGK